MVGIIDYGLGNLGSIKNMLKIIGEKSIITSDRNELDNCDKLILPGVGAFDAGMSKLNELGFKDYLKERTVDKNVPLLGICLGMQLLGNNSEEGELDGLGLIPFTVRRFRVQKMGLKVPHMGWDAVAYEFCKRLLRYVYKTTNYTCHFGR